MKSFRKQKIEPSPFSFHKLTPQLRSEKAARKFVLSVAFGTAYYAFSEITLHDLCKSYNW